MIANKIVRSFYLMEVRGPATKFLFGGEFGINEITVGSLDFEDDLSATSALKDAMDAVNKLVDGKTNYSVEYNPEFFPMIGIEHDVEGMEAQAAMMAMDMEDGKVPIVMSNEFDSLGDFVQSRWTSSDGESIIVGRVVANPTEYMRLKAVDQLERKQSIKLSEDHLLLH